MMEALTFARRHLHDVRIGDDVLDTVIEITSHFEIDGHRADITMLRALKAHAALHRRCMVTKEDIRKVAHLVLAHRMRRRPFEESAFDVEELESCLQGM